MCIFKASPAYGVCVQFFGEHVLSSLLKMSKELRSKVEDQKEKKQKKAVGCLFPLFYAYISSFNSK